jgi:hypothetical protein
MKFSNNDELKREGTHPTVSSGNISYSTKNEIDFLL